MGVNVAIFGACHTPRPWKYLMWVDRAGFLSISTLKPFRGVTLLKMDDRTTKNTKILGQQTTKTVLELDS